MAIVASRTHLVRWLGLLALLPPAAAVGAPPSTITKSEIRSDPPSVTDRKLKDVLWSLFEKPDRRGEKAPTRPLSTLFLETRTQATRVPGLCRYDRVRVEFERANPSDKGPGAPARPVGLTSTSNFTFLSAPTAGYDDIVRDNPVPAAQCSKLPEDQSFFTARNAEEATEGFRAWTALLDEVRAGRRIPLECDLGAFEKRSCEAVIGAFGPEQLEEVESCDSDPEVVCHKFRVYDQELTVVSTDRVHPGPPPGRIVRAKLDTFILMWHEIPD